MVLAVGLLGGTVSASHPAGSYEAKAAECRSLPDRSAEQRECRVELRCMYNNHGRESWSEEQWDAYYAFVEATGFIDPCSTS